jgi:hypothetical protein
MSSRSKRSNGKKREKHQQAEVKTAEVQKSRPLLKRFGLHSYHAVMVTATIVGGLAVLIPRTTVSASDPVDPTDAFSSLVTITNSGFIPLLAVKSQIALQRISIRNGGLVQGAPNYKTRLQFVEWTSHDLSLDDRFTFALNDIYRICPQRVDAADIAVVVNYEVPLIHWKVERIYPLFARRQTNGQVYWYANSVVD